MADPAAFSDADYRDLLAWFNLAWIDPEFLAQSPLKELVEKDRGFSEADKTVLFNEIREIMAKVLPVHKELQDAGQIVIQRLIEIDGGLHSHIRGYR